MQGGAEGKYKSTTGAGWNAIRADQKQRGKKHKTIESQVKQQHRVNGIAEVRVESSANGRAGEGTAMWQ